MNNSQYRAFVKSLEDVFAALYLVNVGSLTHEQKVAHQIALNAAYSAMLSAQNAQLQALSDETKLELPVLAAATEKMKDQLAGLQKVGKVLKVVNAGLSVLTSIVKLLP